MKSDEPALWDVKIIGVEERNHKMEIVCAKVGHEAVQILNDRIRSER